MDEGDLGVTKVCRSGWFIASTFICNSARWCRGYRVGSHQKASSESSSASLMHVSHCFGTAPQLTERYAEIHRCHRYSGCCQLNHIVARLVVHFNSEFTPVQIKKTQSNLFFFRPSTYRCNGINLLLFPPLMSRQMECVCSVSACLTLSDPPVESPYCRQIAHLARSVNYFTA